MKKMICVLLSLLCVLSAASALAENDFTLRGQIHFREDKATVESKETWTPVTGFHVFSYQGEFELFEDSVPAMVNYGYNDEKQLVHVMYALDACYDEEGKTRYGDTSCFFELSVGLTMKYGMPTTGTNKAYENPAYAWYVNFLNSVSSSGTADFEAITEGVKPYVWVAPCGDGQYVTITLSMFHILQKGENRYLTLLTYSAETEEEMEECRKLLQSL